MHTTLFHFFSCVFWHCNSRLLRWNSIGILVCAVCISAGCLPAVDAASPVNFHESTPQNLQFDFLADMKRTNEAESDHRNFMTPEFRDFCIKTREHIVSCALFLILFVCTYALVYRACALPQQQQQQQNHQHTLCNVNSARPLSGKDRRGTRYLIFPYSSTFRSRQISLVISSAGLASACMTAILLAVTVALANAMEHGDPHSLTSWRTWLLPSSLLAPGEGQTADSQNSRLTDAVVSSLGGPQMAHDFPPFLRRLWLYQSVISVSTATVILPIGILFERTSRKESSLHRLAVACIRWMMCALLVLVVWESACQRIVYLQALGLFRPLSTGGATIRYSVYHAICIFVSLPTVLAIVPRGTWALFSWIKCCVAEKHELAFVARIRYRKLKHEKSRIERQLQKAIGSWKWESFRESSEAWAFDDFGDIEADEPPMLRSPPASLSRNSISDLPPVHPGLPPKMDAAASTRPFRTVGHSHTRISARPRILKAGGSPSLAAFQPPDVAMDFAPSFHQASTQISPKLTSASMFFRQPDDSDSSDDGVWGYRSSKTAQQAHRKRRSERERAMKQLSRQIKKYHAQLLFISEDMRSLNESEILDMVDNNALANKNNSGSVRNSRAPKRATLMSFLGSASSVLVTVAASLCWLLVVLQVGRGALCAIFVGEPDLTHNFTYFIPALFQESNDGVDSTAEFGSESSAHLDIPHVGNTIWQHALTPLLVTFCQMVSSTLLFVVVMFGVLSMGSSVEDSVHPLRFLVASYSGSLLRARQWHWLPYFLLSKSVLVHIDSTRAVAHFASNNQLGPVAGNTSRVFFSSSSDLTSFYQNLLRQTADGPTVPTTLLPGGILPESFLKSKMWGRRVFLLFAGNAHASNRTEDSKGAKALASPSVSQKVSTKQLLAYAWIVCGLSMTWPSVLRTTGLISERAYILPIASMVQPLWAQYNNEQDFSASAASIPVDDAAELDEGIVGLLATPALLTDEAVARECTFDLCLTDNAADGLPRDVLANDRTLFCDKKYSGQLNAGTGTGTGTGTGACPRNTLYNDVQSSSMHWPLESWLTLNKTSENLAGTTDDPVPATQMAFERKVSRKQLHQSLSVDTLQRRLARWCVRLACQITPHTCISTGYIVWWLSPDLIVPISPVTVDMQLGYQPPSTSGWNRALVLQPSAFSEWYGMLRRLERGSVWLPHADDGTPLRLQRQARPPSVDSEVSSQSVKQHHPFENSQLVPAVRRWIQMTFEAGMHGLRLASLQLKGFLSVLVQRMWSAGVLFVRMAVSSVISSIQGTRAGAVVTTAVDILSCVASGVAFIVGSIWTAVLCPLWYYLLLVAEIIFGCVALAASCAASAVMSILGSMSLPEKEPGVSQTGAVGVASPLFVSEYWDSVAGYGGDPALQRLRPELWPHVVANSADSTVVLNDAMAQPQHPALDLHKDKQAGGGHSADVAGGGSRTASAAASWAITAEKGLASEDGSSSSSVGAAGAGKQERERSAAPDPAQTRRSRKAWTTLDWLLAAYRVALSILAFRTVFQPSRSSRMFVV